MTVETVFELLENTAARFGPNIAVVDRQGSMTFTELLEESAYLRDRLMNEGLGPGHGLGLMAENGRGFIIGLFAGAGTGATVMPISHQLKPDELNREIQQAGLHAVLADNSGPSWIGTSAVAVSWSGVNGTFIWTSRDRNLPMVNHVPAHFVRFTSGTTGSSKGVILSNRSVLERTAVAWEQLRLGPDDAVAWVLPMAFHFVVSILFYVRYAVKIVVCENFMARNIIEAANRHGGTLLYAAPMQIRFLAADTGNVSFKTLRQAVSTSSSLPPSVAEAFEARFGIPVRSGYGIIEAGLPILNQRTDPRLAAALGDPAPSFEVGILGADGKECPEGRIGELVLRGPGMFEGYLDPPVSHQEVMTDGWFHTGDLAKRDKTGLIWIEGREKTLINVSGNKVFPEEVESVLNQAPGVQLSRVFGVEHPIFGEIVHAEIRMKPGAAFSESDLHKHCGRLLSSYKIPQQFKPVDVIPLTNTGKVRRHGVQDKNLIKPLYPDEPSTPRTLQSGLKAERF